MSKSRGNVVNPDDIVNEYGADTMRMYEMFIGDFEKAAPWSSKSIKGCKRFIDKIWALQDILVDGGYRKELETEIHKTIKKVTEDIENLKMNTAIASMMSLLNAITATGKITKEEYRTLIVLLNPFAPHITEEIWQTVGFDGMLNETEWPKYDENKCRDSQVEIAVQVNGKIRARIKLAPNADKQFALDTAKNDEKVAADLAGKNILKEIYIPGKIINIVAK